MTLYGKFKITLMQNENKEIKEFINYILCMSHREKKNHQQI